MKLIARIVHAAAPLIMIGAAIQAVGPEAGGKDAWTAVAGPQGRFEFLFDDRDLDHHSGVEWVSGPLQRHREPVLKPERDWESDGFGFFSMIFDSEEKRFKVWYRAYALTGTAKQDDPVEAKRRAFLCYAESPDGISWIRPVLRLVDFGGNKENNIIMATDVHDTAFYNITKDIAEPDPSRRYKAIGFDRTAHSNLRDRPNGGVGLCVAFSPDGFNWTTPPLLVMDTSDVTDANCLLPERDADTGEWIAYLRPRTSPKRRFLGFATSRDFEHWTHPRMLLTPDAGDDEWTEFYGMASRNIGGWRIGALWVFRNDPAYSPVSNELVSSRHGREFTRAAPRRAWLGFGRKEDFDSTMVMPYSILEAGGEVRVYYRGCNFQHGSTRRPKATPVHQANGAVAYSPPATKKSGIGMASLPWGQFRGVRAADEGVVETKWLTSYGKPGLQIVADLEPDGKIEVELLDVFGAVLPGLSGSESRLQGSENGITTVTWEGSRPLVDADGAAPRIGLGSHVLKVRFILKKATLYGFKVGDGGSSPDYLR